MEDILSVEVEARLLIAGVGAEAADPVEEKEE
jgi:hypothetical protein